MGDEVVMGWDECAELQLGYAEGDEVEICVRPSRDIPGPAASQ